MMDCEQYEQILGGWDDGELWSRVPPETAAEMRRHEAGCSACAELRRAMDWTREALADLPRLEMPAALRARIQARTFGARAEAGWGETLRSLGEMLLRPRLAMGFGMALFAGALLLNAAGLNLRQMRWRELTPNELAANARQGLRRNWDRGARYYQDLKLAVQIQAEAQRLPTAGAPSAPAGGAPPPGGAASPTPKSRGRDAAPAAGRVSGAPEMARANDLTSPAAPASPAGDDAARSL